MQQGLLARISRTSVLEYHAFGIISYVPHLLSVAAPNHIRLGSEGPRANRHYLICGVQGDFTRSLLMDPPEYLWTRQLKVCGRSIATSLAGMLFVLIIIAVCWRLEHVHAIHAWCAGMHRYGHWCRPVYLPSGEYLSLQPSADTLPFPHSKSHRMRTGISLYF